MLPAFKKFERRYQRSKYASYSWIGRRWWLLSAIACTLITLWLLNVEGLFPNTGLHCTTQPYEDRAKIPLYQDHGYCDPTKTECDRLWQYWLLHGRIANVSDGPGCCRGWHVFDIFTVTFEGGYKAIMKARKVHEMAADIFAFHADRVLGLELTPALFGFVVDDVDTFRELFSPVADRENDVRETRVQQFEEKLKQYNEFGGALYGHVQPFLKTKFKNVDGSVCAKFPEEPRHPKVVFNCENYTYLNEKFQPDREPSTRSPMEKNLTCKAQEVQIVDVLVFDFLLNIVDRKGNCFLGREEGNILLLDNDSGSLNPSKKYPHGSGFEYPSLKRVRLRDVIETYEREKYALLHPETPTPTPTDFQTGTNELSKIADGQGGDGDGAGGGGDGGDGGGMRVRELGQQERLVVPSPTVQPGYYMDRMLLAQQEIRARRQLILQLAQSKGADVEVLRSKMQVLLRDGYNRAAGHLTTTLLSPQDQLQLEADLDKDLLEEYAKVREDGLPIGFERLSSEALTNKISELIERENEAERERERNRQWEALVKEWEKAAEEKKATEDALLQTQQQPQQTADVFPINNDNNLNNAGGMDFPWLHHNIPLDRPDGTQGVAGEGEGEGGDGDGDGAGGESDVQIWGDSVPEVLPSPPPKVLTEEDKRNIYKLERFNCLFHRKTVNRLRDLLRDQQYHEKAHEAELEARRKDKEDAKRVRQEQREVQLKRLEKEKEAKRKAEEEAEQQTELKKREEGGEGGAPVVDSSGTQQQQQSGSWRWEENIRVDRNAMRKEDLVRPIGGEGEDVEGGGEGTQQENLNAQQQQQQQQQQDTTNTTTPVGGGSVENFNNPTVTDPFFWVPMENLQQTDDEDDAVEEEMVIVDDSDAYIEFDGHVGVEEYRSVFGLGGALRDRLKTDKIFYRIAGPSGFWTQKVNPFDEINRRLERLLEYVDACLHVWGEHRVLID